MPLRPVLKPKEGRPVSAVYIGKGDASNSGSNEASRSPQVSTSTSLPELPEPPSPTYSIGSVKSGLPSPPGTNSTGSGSTGDPATIAIRKRPISLHSNSSTSTSSGSHTTPVRRDASSSRSSSRLADHEDKPPADSRFDDDYDRDHEHEDDSNLDGDDTARLDRNLLSPHSMDTLKSKSSSETKFALQRAKSLAQRNRLVIDKLSRLGSPSPARSGTPNSRSPAPSQTGSSRSQSIRTVRTMTQTSPQYDTIRSGSETERESTHQSNSTHSHSSHSTSSHSRSVSSIHRSASQYSNSQSSTTPPPSSERSDVDPNKSPYSRLRHISGSESPHTTRAIAGSTASDSKSGKSPSHRKRNRISIASAQLTDFVEEPGAAEASGARATTSPGKERKDRMLSEADRIAQSALAAVASSRRSPVGHRRRGALPREFRSDLADDSPLSAAKMSAGWYDAEGRSPEEEKAKIESMQPFTPFRHLPNNVGRSSTVRERRVPVSPRWSSDDYRTPATLRTRPFNPSYSNEDGNPRRERQQSQRGGSIESALWSPTGRSLVSEGLRAAGLTRRKDEEPKRNGDARESGGDVFKVRTRKIDWNSEDVIDDGSRRVLVDRERERITPQRASTSMAQYQYLDRDSPDMPRGHRASYSLALPQRDLSGERASSGMGRYTPGNTPHRETTHLQERIHSASPFGSRRYGATLTPQTEHARLMLDSLTLFETSLTKIPRSEASRVSMGSLSSHADVLQNAHSMVFAADRLYNLLKQGSARAIEAQVEAEVESTTEDPQAIIDLWGKVAADYREGSRMTDDLIRSITGVLLGIRRVMREFTIERGVGEYGSPSAHGRHTSLGDDLRRISPEVSHLNSSGGRSENDGERQSVSSRSSRDHPKDREREREDTLRGLAGGAVRPESVLARTSPATFQRLRNREHMDLETPSPLTNGRVGGSIRRSSTLHDQRASIQDYSTLRGSSLVPADSQETIHQSSTPASKQKSSPAVSRPRTLPPLSIPRPLPTLPSETTRRTTDESGRNDSSSHVRDREKRRGTIRGNERPVFPLTSPANPTTVLTPHTVSNSERSLNPLQRTESTKSGRSQVTFSRPTAVSVEKSLSELQQADGLRQRTISTSSYDGPDVSPPEIVRRTGSETERGARKTPGTARARMSLDIQRENDRHLGSGVRADSRKSTSHAADRSAATMILTAADKRDKRRTVTDIWQR